MVVTVTGRVETRLAFFVSWALPVMFLQVIFPSIFFFFPIEFFFPIRVTHRLTRSSGSRGLLRRRNWRRCRAGQGRAGQGRASAESLHSASSKKPPAGQKPSQEIIHDIARESAGPMRRGRKDGRGSVARVG